MGVPTISDCIITTVEIVYEQRASEELLNVIIDKVIIILQTRPGRVDSSRAQLRRSVPFVRARLRGIKNLTPPDDLIIAESRRHQRTGINPILSL